MTTTEEKSDSDSKNDSDSDSENDNDSDNDENEELMLDLKKVSKKGRETILRMMKKVMRQDQEMKRQKKLLNKKDDEIKCLALMKEKNHALKAELDKLTSKHMDFQNLHQKLKCSNERLVDSFATLEIDHEVIVTVVKSYKPIDNTCSQNENKFFF